MTTENLYTPSNTPKGKFQKSPIGYRGWMTATLQEVAQDLRDYSGNPTRDYHNMIFYALRGDIRGDIRLGDTFYRFYPFFD